MADGEKDCPNCLATIRWVFISSVAALVYHSHLIFKVHNLGRSARLRKATADVVKDHPNWHYAGYST
jgi:uncharacterized protein (UPF0212 family)